MLFCSYCFEQSPSATPPPLLCSPDLFLLLLFLSFLFSPTGRFVCSLSFYTTADVYFSFSQSCSTESGCVSAVCEQGVLSPRGPRPSVRYRIQHVMWCEVLKQAHVYRALSDSVFSWRLYLWILDEHINSKCMNHITSPCGRLRQSPCWQFYKLKAKRRSANRAEVGKLHFSGQGAAALLNLKLFS